MEKEYFKNGYEGGTPIPKAMYWYCYETLDKNTHINADLCNKLLNNELKDFFEKYPEELKKPCTFNLFVSKTNITDEDIEFYKSEIKINKEG